MEGHLLASASQGHKPDVSCRESWVPPSGTKAGDLNTNANHVTVCTNTEPSAECERLSGPIPGCQVFQSPQGGSDLKKVSTATPSLPQKEEQGMCTGICKQFSVKGNIFRAGCSTGRRCHKRIIHGSGSLRKF